MPRDLAAPRRVPRLSGSRPPPNERISAPAGPASGRSAILRLDHVSKRYGRRLVLDDVDLVLPSGSFTLLVGPNGGGKTTLLRLLSTYARPTVGQVRWGRRDGGELGEAFQVRRHVGYAGHTPLLYDELTVREHVAFELLIRGRPGATGDAWLETFGLERLAEERAEALSRGQRQRLALALAFAPGPDILLLDEPSSNLDAAGQEALLASLRAVRGTATVVVATHEPDPFRPLADRTLEVAAGRLRDWGGAP